MLQKIKMRERKERYISVKRAYLIVFQCLLCLLLLGCQVNTISATDDSNIDRYNELQSDNIESKIVSDTIKTVSGTNTEYWSDREVQFEFIASADIVYDTDLQVYTMSNITASRPIVMIQSGSDVSAVTTIPTVESIEDGHVVVLISTATIQNATGYAEDVTIRMTVYCDASSGELSMLSDSDNVQ